MVNTVIMFLRRNKKKKGGVDYESWTLVESVRTARGPRQRIVATIGKLPGLDREERIGWDEIGRILSGKPRPSPGFFDQPEEAVWRQLLFPLSDNYNSRFPLASKTSFSSKAGETEGARRATGGSPAGHRVSPAFRPVLCV
jgi:hypothetical protein